MVVTMLAEQIAHGHEPARRTDAKADLEPREAP
jgi:hypothetical protein